MELHRLRELIDLAKVYIAEGNGTIDALKKAEEELKNGEDIDNDNYI